MSSGDWEKLTPEQQKEVDALRDRMCRHLIAEAEAFYVHRPELQLTWSFTLDPLIRGQHDTLRDDRQMTSERLAHLFHETYERLAPGYGYATRSETAIPWLDIPGDNPNKRLMIAVAGEVLKELGLA